ncbi:TetR/AcrR family transcriptional regulator [Methylorubrum sp. SB2]|uniref:TetR/AcrR family transcriptional regulator n=1 Tax=Methylorubrum subtropicum TaxID=3138812 RepID=UPI00313AA79D
MSDPLPDPLEETGEPKSGAPKSGAKTGGKAGARTGKAKQTAASEAASHAESHHDEAHAKPNPREAAVEALMRLAAEQPWNDIEIGDIAREADLSLAELRELFPSKGAVLGGLSRIIDRAVLKDDSSDLADEPARERLFDVLMRRLDAMTPYKPALRRIAFALRGDPLSMLALNGVALNSHRYMLAAAGIDTEGPLGRVKIQGTVVAFARTVEVWLDDDDPALARTMAKLDREIRRGETFMERAEDARRLTAPLRAIGRALMERRPRREHRERSADEDPAAAI